MPPNGKLAVAGLAVELLNEVVVPVVAITDAGTIVPEAQRSGMDGGVGDALIVTVGIGAGLAMRVDRFLAERPAAALPLRL